MFLFELWVLWFFPWVGTSLTSWAVNAHTVSTQTWSKLTLSAALQTVPAVFTVVVYAVFIPVFVSVVLKLQVVSALHDIIVDTAVVFCWGAVVRTSDAPPYPLLPVSSLRRSWSLCTIFFLLSLLLAIIALSLLLFLTSSSNSSPL